MADYGAEHDKYFDHPDDEGGMAKRQLYKIAKYATMLHDSLEDEDQLVVNLHQQKPQIIWEPWLIT